MRKHKFNSEAEATAYKEKHRLYGMVAESMTGTSKWILVFPIKAHITVNPGAPSQEELQEKR